MKNCSEKKYPNYFYFIDDSFTEDGEEPRAVRVEGYVCDFTDCLSEELGREPIYSVGHENYKVWDGNYVYEDHEDGVSLSQNIFNDDDNYEYIRFLYSDELGKESNYDSNEEWIYNPIDTIQVYASYKLRGFEIVNEQGEVKAQMRWDEPYDDVWDIQIFIMDGEEYLTFVNGEGFNESQKCYVYKIDRETSSVKEVPGDFRVNFSPRVARRSQNVTVSLDAPAKQSADLVVTGMDGRVIAKRVIRAGQQSVQVNTANMSSGLYNFTVSSKGKRIENGKIIVK